MKTDATPPQSTTPAIYSIAVAFTTLPNGDGNRSWTIISRRNEDRNRAAYWVGQQDPAPFIAVYTSIFTCRAALDKDESDATVAHGQASHSLRLSSTISMQPDWFSCCSSCMTRAPHVASLRLLLDRLLDSNRDVGSLTCLAN